MTAEREQMPTLPPRWFIRTACTTRNYNDQAKHIEGMTDLDFIFYCDPQTSGGLLFSVTAEQEATMDLFLKEQNQFVAKVGKIVAKREKDIVFV